VIRYRVSRNSDGQWEVCYRYRPDSRWYRISTYRHWNDAMAHAFEAAGHARIKLAINQAYGK